MRIAPRGFKDHPVVILASWLSFRVEQKRNRNPRVPRFFSMTEKMYFVRCFRWIYEAIRIAEEKRTERVDVSRWGVGPIFYLYFHRVRTLTIYKLQSLENGSYSGVVLESYFELLQLSSDRVPSELQNDEWFIAKLSRRMRNGSRNFSSATRSASNFKMYLHILYYFFLLLCIISFLLTLFISFRFYIFYYYIIVTVFFVLFSSFNIKLLSCARR